MSFPNPSPWQQLQDVQSGRPYYYNLITNQTQWERPSSFVPLGSSLSPPRGRGRGDAATSVPSSAGPRNPVSNPHAAQPRRPSSISSDSGYTIAGRGTVPQSDLSDDFNRRLNINPQDRYHAPHAHGDAATATYDSTVPAQRSQYPPRPEYGASSASSSTTNAAAHAHTTTQHQRKLIGGKDGDRPGTTSNLDPEFKVRKNPVKFFRLGQVFLTIHAESTTRPEDGRSEITRGYLGQNVYSEICRFVVIREGKGSCAALRILTYTGRGCGKTGVHKADHARIYTSPEPPMPTDAERFLKRGELPMQVAAFKVTPHLVGEKLESMSRINLAKVYTIEHNVRVRGFGSVVNFQELYYLHRTIWDNGSTAPGANMLDGSSHGKSPATDEQVRQFYAQRIQHQPQSPYSLRQQMPPHEEQDADDADEDVEEQRGSNSADDEGSADENNDDDDDYDNNNNQHHNFTTGQ